MVPNIDRIFSTTKDGSQEYIVHHIFSERIIHEPIQILTIMRDTDFVDKAYDGEDFSEPVSLDDLLSGQAAARWKREILSYRLHLLTERGEVVPKKRVLESEGSGLSYIEREKYKHTLVLQTERVICTTGCVILE